MDDKLVKALSQATARIVREHLAKELKPIRRALDDLEEQATNPGGVVQFSPEAIKSLVQILREEGL